MIALAPATMAVGIIYAASVRRIALTLDLPDVSLIARAVRRALHSCPGSVGLRARTWSGGQ